MTTARTPLILSFATVTIISEHGQTNSDRHARRSRNHVQFKNTLSAWKEHLPPVYSTPNMIGIMESAGYNALEPFCEGDEVSVGTAINIVHRAAATEGMKITTEAVLESFDGRFYTFKVSASNGIEVIGHGTIGRAIVSKAKFEEKQRQKQKSIAAD